MVEKVRTHVFISGKVQGVFFRENTRKKALELNVFGFVRNLQDGRVEAIIEGEKDKVGKLIEWMKKGPSLARVDNIEINFEDYQGEFKNFEIRF